MLAPKSAYTARIDALFRELGIPESYPQQRKLSLQEEACELTSIGPDESGRECRLVPEAALAWEAMRTQARSCAIFLIPHSGFRSVDRQVEIIRRKLSLGQPIEDILRSIAAPGYSEHHTGRALDIGSPESEPLVEAFAETKSFAWLTERANDFGFRLSFPKNNPHGIIYEPWHWCWHARCPRLGKPRH